MLIKCEGHGCPFYSYCFRYLVKSEKYQIFFKEIPFKEDECEYFLGHDDWRERYGGEGQTVRREG